MRIEPARLIAMKVAVLPVDPVPLVISPVSGSIDHKMPTLRQRQFQAGAMIGPPEATRRSPRLYFIMDEEGEAHMVRAQSEEEARRSVSRNRD